MGSHVRVSASRLTVLPRFIRRMTCCGTQRPIQKQHEGTELVKSEYAVSCILFAPSCTDLKVPPFTAECFVLKAVLLYSFVIRSHAQTKSARNLPLCGSEHPRQNPSGTTAYSYQANHLEGCVLRLPCKIKTQFG